MEFIHIYLDRLGKNWDTKLGLLNFTILVCALSIGIWKLISKVQAQQILIIAFLALSIYYAAWVYKRLLIFIIFNRVNVVFAFYNASRTQNIEDYIKNINSLFRQSLQSNHLKKVKFHTVGSDKNIKSIQQASKHIKSSYVGQTILVWGEVIEVDGEIRCKNTNFTYEFRTTYYNDQEFEEIKSRFSADLNENFKNYNWNLNLKKRFEIETYADNIHDLSLYILARTLFSVGKFNEGITILHSLIITIESAAANSSGRIATLNTAKKLISAAYLQTANNLEFKKDKQEIKSRVELALKYNQKSYDANLAMAYIYEVHEDDEEKSLEFLRKAEEFHGSGQNAHLVSKAYFYLKNGRFKDALNLYRTIKRTSLQTNPVTLAENLKDVFNKYKTPQFIFAEGFIKYIWLPASDGKRRLKHFLKVTENETNIYEDLRNEAILILEDPHYKYKKTFSNKTRRKKRKNKKKKVGINS